MSEQETQPATCGECRVTFTTGAPPTPLHSHVVLCPLHAQAEALLEALERSSRDVHLLAHQGEQHRYRLDEDDYQRCVIHPCAGDRSTIAAAKGWASERLSVCCGAPEYPDVEGMCGQCRDWTGFEEVGIL